MFSSFLFQQGGLVFLIIIQQSTVRLSFIPPLQLPYSPFALLATLCIILQQCYCVACGTNATTSYMFVILCKCGLLPIAGFSPRSSSYDMEGSVGNEATVQNVPASKDDICLSFFYLLLCSPATRSYRTSVLGASNFSMVKRTKLQHF